MATLQQTIEIHKTMPWIRDFRRVLIRPLRTVDPDWLGPPVTVTVGREGATQTWYPPTDSFWIVHANASHPIAAPTGLHGCSPVIHVSFLTATGGNSEFQYGYECAAGGFHVEEAADFTAECAWWAANFPDA